MKADWRLHALIGGHWWGPTESSAAVLRYTGGEKARLKSRDRGTGDGEIEKQWKEILMPVELLALVVEHLGVGIRCKEEEQRVMEESFFLGAVGEVREKW